MRPKLELLDKPLIERILDEAFQLIEDPGVRVAPCVEDLLRAAGIRVKEGVAHIPEVLAQVRHGTIAKPPKSCRISLGCREVCTTF